ncbi:MAG: cysteine synthase A [Clostridia bacterium]|nr:cysteine synthase A [Clostridia bacterium]
MRDFSRKLIGETPLVELVNITDTKAHIFAKIEGMNPYGSIKDRVALEMIEDAKRKNLLNEGGTIIEATSGNTGIGLAAVGVPLGYRVIIVMPNTMSAERIQLIEAYGAEVVLTDGALGMSGAIAEAERLHNETEGSYIPDQFNNPANVNAHYKTTAPEICKALNGNIDILVAGVGTGGTITGIGRYLKEINPDIKIVAVEPKKSPVLSGGKANTHGLQGIGANFVPKILDISIIDEIIGVDDEDAFDACRTLFKTEGVFAGISSGAAIVAATEIAKREENKNKNIVVILPDSGTRYLSTGIFNKED